FTRVPPSLATPVKRTTYQVVCQAEGFPRPIINWRRVGMSLPAGKTEVNQGILTIKNLTPADSGLYECIATNSVGTKKARINVVVQQQKLDSVIVGNSINYLRTLRSWLSPVARSVNSAWKRCWHASVDGSAASTFHSRCDGKGPTVTIIRVGKYIFGGYTSVSWASSGVYQYDSKAFLFSLVNKPGWAPVKLPQTGKYSSSRYSIYCGSSYGPTFGNGFDIYISSYASTNSNSYSNLGYTYSPPSGYSYSSTFAQTFLAGSYKFTPDEVETFYETN
ncbi:unnamed protein product, partial [Porites lobata]